MPSNTSILAASSLPGQTIPVEGPLAPQSPEGATSLRAAPGRCCAGFLIVNAVSMSGHHVSRNNEKMMENAMSLHQKNRANSSMIRLPNRPMTVSKTCCQRGLLILAPLGPSIATMLTLMLSNFYAERAYKKQSKPKKALLRKWKGH